MTELGNSGEALSGVVMGKMAASALAGQGEAESVTSIAAKIDGGALVSRVPRNAFYISPFSPKFRVA